MVEVSVTTHPAKEQNLEKYIEKALQCGADFIHFDIMDGKFVCDKTFDYETILQMREAFPTAKFAIHLMTENTDQIITNYLKAKPYVVYVHIESFKSLESLIKTLSLIKDCGVKAGICLNLQTQVCQIDKNILNSIWGVLVMGVNAGASGQKVIEKTFLKISELKAINKNLNINFDGGLNKENYKKAIQAGADNLSFGSYLFNELTNGNGELAIKNIKSNN